MSGAGAVPTTACRGDDSPTLPGGGERRPPRQRGTRRPKSLQQLFFSIEQEQKGATVLRPRQGGERGSGAEGQCGRCLAGEPPHGRAAQGAALQPSPARALLVPTLCNKIPSKPPSRSFANSRTLLTLLYLQRDSLLLSACRWKLVLLLFGREKSFLTVLNK